MCGIAGIIQRDPNSFHAEQLHRMTHCLAHRGPDGHGYWQDENNKVLFGHRAHADTNATRFDRVVRVRA